MPFIGHILKQQGRVLELSEQQCPVAAESDERSICVHLLMIFVF